MTLLLLFNGEDLTPNLTPTRLRSLVPETNDTTAVITARQLTAAITARQLAVIITPHNLTSG